MKFSIEVLLCLLYGFLQTGSNFVYINSEKSLNDAVLDCYNQGLELLTMSTYSQYLDAQTYLNRFSYYVEFWLALEINITSGNYQWLNGRVLTELKWWPGFPINHNGTDCGVMDVESRKWYTSPCTESRYYLCVGSDGSYSVGSSSVDFYTAVLNCQSESRRLPVAITNLDTKWLNDVINNTSIVKDIWLGLIEYGDYYRWVTGEHLTPSFNWSSSNQYSPVHYHHTAILGDNVYHSCDGCGYKEYICQTKSTTNTAAVVRSPDKFEFVSNNALVLGTPRKATTINSLRRFQCALKCLKDFGCIQYTTQGYLCRTFGESLVITDYSGGYMLWQRQIIS